MLQWHLDLDSAHNVSFVFDRHVNRYFISWVSTAKLRLRCKSIESETYHWTASFDEGAHTVSVPGTPQEGQLCEFTDVNNGNVRLISHFGESSCEFSSLD